jgi:hypothetical protein
MQSELNDAGRRVWSPGAGLVAAVRTGPQVRGAGCKIITSVEVAT